MGLNIREIVDRRELNISELKGQTLCVDAFNTLYQFLSTIRQPDGTPLMDDSKKITSHLSGIFYRNIALLSEGIKLEATLIIPTPPAFKKGSVKTSSPERI